MRFIGLAVRNLKEMFRDPLSVGFEMGMPAAFLFMFWNLGQTSGGEFFTATMLTPAVTIFGFTFLTMFSAMILALDRKKSLLLRLLTTPLKPKDFILAYYLPFFLIAILQIVVCFAVGFILGLEFHGNAGLLFLILFLMAVCSVGLELTLGSVFTEGQVSGVGTAIIVFVSIFGGLWMDLEAIGGAFQRIGDILPFAHAVDAARDVMQGGGFSDIAIDFYWVVGYTIFFFILGIFCFKWRTTTG